MGPSKVPVVLFLVMAALKALAANMDVNTPHKYEPMVAFICNKPAMHRVVDSWVADVSTDCLQEPVEILKYCKKKYPDHDITNIVESSYKVTIPNWPNKQGREHTHTVRPYRCIVGSFESDALLVPRHCFFDHDHDKVCESYQYWNRTARHKCVKRDMETESFAMLLACDIDRFNGVEFVCCPKDARNDDDDAHDARPDQDTEETDSEEKDGDDKITAEDAYLAYLRGDESFLNKYSNEHEKFLAAEKSMQSHHHEKITKMMKEWQAAREHVAELRRTDYRAAENLNKEITQRFQKMYHAYEQEGLAEKQQLVTLHQQHVQAMLNRKKRVAMEQFMSALQDEPVKNHRVFKYLRAYIRAEEKDRIHTLNHYEHVLDSDPEEGQRIRDQTIEHLGTIDQRVNQSLEMLGRFPKLEEKILPEIEKFRTQFRGIDASAANILLHPVPVSDTEQKQFIDEKDRKQQEHTWLDTEIDTKLDVNDDDDEDDESDDGDDEALFGRKYDSETMEDENVYNNNANFVAHQSHNGQSLEQSVQHPVHHAVSTGNVFGIAIGSVAVFVIIVVAVVMLRKRSHRQPITHGFVEVDPAASPEERHVANMQMNGYENPTYKYFEMKPAQ